jgi:hypothetical protein
MLTYQSCRLRVAVAIPADEMKGSDEILAGNHFSMAPSFVASVV